MKTKHAFTRTALYIAATLWALTGCTENNALSDSHESHEDHSHESGIHDDSHNEGAMHKAHGHEDAHHAATAEAKPADAREVRIIATDFAFDPATVTAKPGEKLYIKLVNLGNAVHMWQLEGKPETHVHTAAGETSTKVVTAPAETGTYQLICSTPGHKELGMVGTLKVE